VTAAGRAGEGWSTRRHGRGPVSRLSMYALRVEQDAVRTCISLQDVSARTTASLSSERRASLSSSASHHASTRSPLGPVDCDKSTDTCGDPVGQLSTSQESREHRGRTEVDGPASQARAESSAFIRGAEQRP